MICQEFRSNKQLLCVVKSFNHQPGLLSQSSNPSKRIQAVNLLLPAAASFPAFQSTASQGLPGSKNRSTLRGLKPTQKHEHVGFIMPCEEKDDWILGFCNPQAVRRWLFRGPLHHPQQPAGLHLKSNHASFSNTKRVRNQNQ